MIEKIKQNPKKVLGAVAGVFFIAAILFMLLPGLTYTAEGMTMSASLFAFAFGGEAFATYAGSKEKLCDMRVNAPTIFAFVLLILAIIILVILICGLFTNKFSKKANITLSIIAIVLVVASAIMILATKNFMIRCFVSSLFRTTEDSVSKYIEMLEEMGKFSVGAGAIVTPIMMLLGAASLGGVICLSAKE